MFKRNVSPNLRGKTRQHYRCEINNGFYEGDMLHYKKDGVGIFIHDDGSVYAGQFLHDVFHGEGILLYKRQGVLYCQFEKGIPNGWCIMNLNGSYICGLFSQSLLHGSVFYYCKESQLWSYLEYQSGKQVRKYAEEQADDVKRIPSFMKKDSTIYQKFINFLEFRVEQIFKKNVEVSLSLLASDEDPHQKCIGFVTKDKHLNGLGFIFNNDSIQMSGSYKEGKISGLGRIDHANGDIYEGFFRQDEMEGQGIYFTKSTDSYVRAIFRHNECVQIISQGSGYPSELCRKMKQRTHQKSLQYMDSSLNLNQIRVSLPTLFKLVKSEALAATKTLKDYFFMIQDSQAIQKSLSSQKAEDSSGQKNSSPNSRQRLSRTTSAQPFSATKQRDLTAQANQSQHRANNFQNQRENQEISTLSQKYEHYLNDLQQPTGQDPLFTDQDINNTSFNRFTVTSQHTLGRTQSPTNRTKRFLPIFQNNQFQNSRNTSPLNNLQSSINNSNLANSAAFSPSRSPQQENMQITPSILITNQQQRQFLVQSKSQSRISYNQLSQSQQFKQQGYAERESASPSKSRKYKPIFASQSLSSLKLLYNPLESSQIQNNSPDNFPKTSQTFYQDTPTSLKNNYAFKQEAQKSEQENQQQKLIGQTQLNQKLKILINQQKQYSPSFKSQFLPFGDNSAFKDQQGKSNADIYHSFKNNFGQYQSPSSAFSPNDKTTNKGLVTRQPVLSASSRLNIDPQVEHQQQDIPVNQGIQMNQQL